MTIETNVTSSANDSGTMWPASFSNAMSRRDLPVEARNSRLPRCASDGQRSGQRQDRPQAEHEREEGSVLVLEVAAHGADVVGDRAAQALQDGRHGTDQVGQLDARLGRVELDDDRLGDTQEDGCQQERRRGS